MEGVYSESALTQASPVPMSTVRLPEEDAIFATTGHLAHREGYVFKR